MEEHLTVNCKIHKQPFIMFYFDCKKLICQHCTLKDPEEKEEGEEEEKEEEEEED